MRDEAACNGHVIELKFFRPWTFFGVCFGLFTASFWSFVARMSAGAFTGACSTAMLTVYWGSVGVRTLKKALAERAPQKEGYPP